MAPSNVWNPSSRTANILGFEPCPKCESTARYTFISDPETIRCMDCGYTEQIVGMYWARWKHDRGIE